MLLAAAILVCALAVLAACPLPIPEAERVDGGIEQNAVPLIAAATPEDLAFPGPLVLDRGDPRTVNVRVTDQDTDDILFARFFRDYQPSNPTPPVVSATGSAAEPGSIDRIFEVAVSTWCAGLDPADTSFHILEVMVADRAFLADGTQGQPLFRALPPEANHALRSWTIVCNPPD